MRVSKPKQHARTAALLVLLATVRTLDVKLSTRSSLVLSISSSAW